MSLRVQRCLYRFRAADPIRFAPGSAANLFRGALGVLLRKLACDAECPGARTCPDADRCSYARCFEPRQMGEGPSGFEDLPRPFVLSAAALDGHQFQSGGEFCLALNFFDLTEGMPEMFAAVFTHLEWNGLGPRRPRIILTGLDRPAPVTVGLESESAARVRVRFLTPMELKFQRQVIHEPRFDVLFARARDRVSQLRALYQEGPLDIDFRGLGERSRNVRLVSLDVERAGSSRRSTRTGQRHDLAGFIGQAIFEGELGEFLPILRAACWTGVGRHTVWGLGAMDLAVLA